MVFQNCKEEREIEVEGDEGSVARLATKQGWGKSEGGERERSINSWEEDGVDDDPPS